MPAFSAQLLKKEIEQLIARGLVNYVETVREFMEDAYDSIVEDSPIITGYYKSNHSIVVRGPGGQFKTQGSRLSPGIKASEEPLVYEPNVGSRASSEKEKLVVFELGDKVEISTIVPYADEVEARHHVYERVAVGFDLNLKTGESFEGFED